MSFALFTCTHDYNSWKSILWTVSYVILEIPNPFRAAFTKIYIWIVLSITFRKCFCNSIIAFWFLPFVSDPLVGRSRSMPIKGWEEYKGQGMGLGKL